MMSIPAPSSETLHVSSVAVNGAAILISGRSGAGKSDLALRLIDRGATLVSDDYTLVKRVGASAGDRVCADGDRIFINGRPAALRRPTDLSGRPMPWWEGCSRLGRGEIF